MFTSVIMIFILLAIGLAALLVGVSGRTSGQGKSLTTRQRAWSVAVGLIAWAGAYFLFERAPTGDVGTVSVTRFGEKPLTAEATGLSLREQAPASKPEPVPAEVAAVDAQRDAAIRPALEEKLVEVTGNTPAAPAASGAAVSRLAPIQRADLPRHPALAAIAPVRAAGNAPLAAPAAGTRYRQHGHRPPAGSRAQGRGTTIHVLNSLGEGQSEERLTLAIEGRPLANFAVNSMQPSVQVPLVLPRPGFLHYTLSGTTLENGYRREAGSGCIEMLNQASFEVRRTEDGSKLYLHRVATHHYR